MTKEINKFIELMQLYGEVGASFVLEGENIGDRATFLIPRETYAKWGDSLNINIKREGMMSQYEDYSLGFVITATKKSDELTVRGPDISHADRHVHFAIWIPYNKVMEGPEPLYKITEYFKRGVYEALLKLDYPESSANLVYSIIH